MWLDSDHLSGVCTVDKPNYLRFLRLEMAGSRCSYRNSSYELFNFTKFLQGRSNSAVNQILRKQGNVTFQHQPRLTLSSILLCSPSVAPSFMYSLCCLHNVSCTVCRQVMLFTSWWFFRWPSGPCSAVFSSRSKGGNELQWWVLFYMYVSALFADMHPLLRC